VLVFLASLAIWRDGVLVVLGVMPLLVVVHVGVLAFWSFDVVAF
jgi:hypothetical protein